MRISDWSSDVCSSDLLVRLERAPRRPQQPRTVSHAFKHAGDHLGRFVVDQIIDHVADVDVARVARRQEIGRAACWERECQYVLVSVVAGSLQKKTTTQR